MTTTKKIVNDFFGGLNGSVGIALKDNPLYEVRTFDIEPKTKDGRDNIVIDMTEDITTLIPKLIKLGIKKGEIIIASTMCNAFSTARRYKDGGTGAFIINENGSLSNRDHNSWKQNMSIKRNDKWEGIEDRRFLGLKAIENIIMIIKYFEPKYWYIENPELSLIWNYIEHNLKFRGIKNKTIYCAYGFNAEKATIFMSNISLNLRVIKSVKTIKGIDDMSTKDRSDIPKALLQHIFEKFETPDPQQIELFKVRKDNYGN